MSGATDGGFGRIDASFGDLLIVANGTINWPLTYAFGYTAHPELAVLGKDFTKLFCGAGNGTKLYSYYQACSQGGREGLSQVQRFPEQWDGAVIDTPASHFSFQQTQHLYSAVAEKTLGYNPPPY